MAARVVWADLAWDDLDAAAEYISRDSPRYAAAFVKKVLEAVRLVREFPHIGRAVPELNTENVREVLVHSHRVIYRVEQDRLVVLGIFHGARDLLRLWERENRDRGPSE
jgi:toxin ParE1/3/4